MPGYSAVICIGQELARENNTGPVEVPPENVLIDAANSDGFLGAGYVQVSFTSGASGTFSETSASRKMSRVAAISSGLKRSQQVTLACSSPRRTTVLGLTLKSGRRAAIPTLRPSARAIASRIVVLPMAFGPTRRVKSRTRSRGSVNGISSGWEDVPRCLKFSMAILASFTRNSSGTITLMHGEAPTVIVHAIAARLEGPEKVSGTGFVDRG